MRARAPQLRAEKLDAIERTLVSRVAQAYAVINPKPEETLLAGSGGEEIAADRFEP